MTTPGYSGKPLSEKLGLKAGARVVLHDAPTAYWTWLTPHPNVVVLPTPSAFDFAHGFFTRRTDLAAALTAWLPHLEPSGMIWVSWTKKSAKMPTDITEDTVRAVALALGLVDVKVCAVSDVWSGLKLVLRKNAYMTKNPATV